jgi:predicted transcriptional regulator
MRHRDAEEERRVQAQPAACLRGTEGRERGVIELERGFEVGAGAGEGDGGDALAQVEAFAEDRLAVIVERLRWGKQTAHAAAQVGGAGEVRLGGRVGPAQREDAGRGRDLAQNAVGFGGMEVEVVVEGEGLGHRENCRRKAEARSYTAGMELTLKPELEERIQQKLSEGYDSVDQLIESALDRLDEANRGLTMGEIRSRIDEGWAAADRGESISGEEFEAEMDAWRAKVDAAL